MRDWKGRNYWGRERETQFCMAWLHTITPSLSHFLDRSQWVPHTKGGAYTGHEVGLPGGCLGSAYCSQVHCPFLCLKLFCLLSLCMGTCPWYSRLVEVRGQLSKLVFCPQYGFGALDLGGQACVASAFGCRAMVPATVSSCGAADLDWQKQLCSHLLDVRHGSLFNLTCHLCGVLNIISYFACFHSWF